MPGLQIFLPSLSLSPYICRNCGFSQRLFKKPDSCPVCVDYRHILPTFGWAFYDAKEATEMFPMHYEEIMPGLWRFWNDPVDGIGSHSYLFLHPDGNVIFEGASIYSPQALAFIKKLGGVKFASASHPHTFGALWQLQDYFDANIVLHVNDLSWSSAFRVTHPFSTSIQLNADFTQFHVGVHFEGQSFFHSRIHHLLCCGDSMKIDFSKENPNIATGISSHKSFVRNIPLTKCEIQQYKQAFSTFKFANLYTPFEQVTNINNDIADEYFKCQFNKYPFVNFIDIKDLTLINN